MCSQKKIHPQLYQLVSERSMLCVSHASAWRCKAEHEIPHYAISIIKAVKVDVFVLGRKGIKNRTGNLGLLKVL